MMDPIKNGHEIFREVLKDYPDSIINFDQVRTLLEQLIEKTQCLVIVDFLDGGCWDKISKVETDSEQGWLYLIDSVADENGQRVRTALNGFKDGLALKFKDAFIYNTEDITGVFIRGYTVSEKVIKRKFSQNATDFSITPYRDRNFAVTIERKLNNVKESIDVFNSPIYSIAIIPKNTILGTDGSQELLFTINFYDCLQRLQTRHSQLTVVNETDEDTICEKVNSGRRIFEFVLKIECCLIEHGTSLFGYENVPPTKFKDDYDALMLGPLKKMVSKFKPIKRQNDLEEIVIGCNKLSHDSGHPIVKHEAELLLLLMIDYVKELMEIITSHKLTTAHYSTNFKEANFDISKFQIKTFSNIKVDDSIDNQ